MWDASELIPYSAINHGGKGEEAGCSSAGERIGQQVERPNYY